MRVLMLNKSDRYGGAAQVAWNLKRGLEARGQAVDFFVSERRSADPHVFALPRSRARWLLSHLAGTDLDFFASDRLLATKEFRQADIVHLHNIHSHYFNLTTFIKICRAKPVVWTLHDLWPVTAYCPHALDNKLSDGLYFCPTQATRSLVKKYNQHYLMARKRTAYKKINFNLVVPSLVMAEKLKGTVLKNFPCRLIHHGIDLKIFAPGDKAAARKKLGLPLDKKIILFSAAYGKDDVWKGWNFCRQIIEHYRADDQVIFLCLGGKEKKQQGRLFFLPFTDKEANLADYYRAADLLLVPSLAESFSLVVIEALACGTPVVSFPVGIASEVIERGINGYLARQQDGADLLAGVKFILEQGGALEKNCRQTVAGEYGVDLMTTRYLELYHSILH